MNAIFDLMAIIMIIIMIIYKYFDRVAYQYVQHCISRVLIQNGPFHFMVLSKARFYCNVS